MKLRAIAYIIALVLLFANDAVARPQTQSPIKLFEFHSGFWVNLHHFLYREAQVSSGNRRVTIAKEDAEETGRLSSEERVTWNAATAYYASSIVDRDLLFDRELIAIKNDLEDQEASGDLANSNLPVELKTALLKAAPIYRKYWWARQDATNWQWITNVEKLVDQYGNEMQAELVKIFDEPWTGNPVRVDAVAYANWAGAYTTIHPTRPTVSTGDPSNRGSAALEIVFHETSHGMMDKVRKAIDAAEARANARRSIKFDSGQLWHAVLFYTAGELVAERIPGYVPYAEKNGLWSRAWRDSDRALIDKDWKPHMNGKTTLQHAIDMLIADEAEPAKSAK